MISVAEFRAPTLRLHISAEEETHGISAAKFFVYCHNHTEHMITFVVSEQVVCIVTTVLLSVYNC
jgi:hypothetical protein